MYFFTVVSYLQNVMRSRCIHSEVEHVTFSVSYLVEILIRRGTFCRKPHLNRTSGSKVITIEIFSKQLKTISQSMFPTLTDPARSQHKYDEQIVNIHNSENIAPKSTLTMANLIV